MLRKLCFLLACLALLVSLGCQQAGHEEPQVADASGGEADENAALEEAVGAVFKAYSKAETFDEKLAVVQGFLAEHPETEYTDDALGVISRDAVKAEQPDVAYKLFDEYLPKIQDEDIRFDTQIALAALHGSAGKVDELKALTNRLSEEHGLRFRDHMRIMETAVEAKAWELLVDQAEASASYATAEAYKEDSPEVSDEDAAKYGKRRLAYTAAYKGLALGKLGRTEEALATFEEGAPHTVYSAIGVDHTPLQQYWGETLLESGDAVAAMKRLESEALFGFSDEARETYKKAYSACHDGEDGFEDHLWDLRQKKARPLEGFSLKDYDGETVDSASFQGDVVLLAFWFPT